MNPILPIIAETFLPRLKQYVAAFSFATIAAAFLTLSAPLQSCGDVLQKTQVALPLKKEYLS
jgi:hypothetical protein